MNTNKIIDKLKKQDKFILDFFNDKRISDEVKLEWMQKYNELKIKIDDN